MKYNIFKNKKEASIKAAQNAALILKKAIKTKGHATLVAATGKSQFAMLKVLVKDKSINWSKITLFHLDEYLGISKKNRASFRKYLNDRLISKVNFKEVNLINGSSNGKKEVIRLNKLISGKKIDLTFLGLGENGHLAFNDPPADFNTTKPYIIVKLSNSNRTQQVKEGWFSSHSLVPKYAISMSIKQIIKSKNIICLVFGTRKAKIFQECFTKKITPNYPASILQKHKKVSFYLNQDVMHLK